MWNIVLQVTNTPVEDQKELVELVRRVHVGAGWEVPHEVDALEKEARMGSLRKGISLVGNITTGLQVEGQSSMGGSEASSLC